MKVLNIHEREFRASPQQVGVLIDSLASPKDSLWPRHSWPPMKLDRPLGVGARGGHGPIRYFVEECMPGQAVRFRFTGPVGFDGVHSYQIVSAPGADRVLLRHTIDMTVHGRALLSWPLIFRPLHDALMEDSLATAEASLGHSPGMQPWSLWVRFLRWIISGSRTRKQRRPKDITNASPDA
ncbi:MAG: hypothetical protein WC378_16660 [Opitutaceae bacterium]|jgi:hypothetical protein